MTHSLRRTAATTLRSAAVVGGGTVLAQVVTAAVSPLLTRLFSPSDFGALGLFVSFLLIASVGLSLRYDTAIPTPSDDREAARLAIAAVTLVLPMALLAATVYAVLMVADVASFGMLAPWTVGAMLVGLTAFGTVTALRYWAIRRALFRVIAELTVLQSATRASIQVLLGAVGLGSGGLIAGEVIGRLAGTLRLARAVRDDLSALLDGWWAPEQAAGLLSRYRAFPMFGLPSSLINALALYLPVPVVVALYGAGAGGALLLVQRIVSIPLAVVGASIADVFHSRAAGATSRGEPIQRLTADHAAMMFLIGMAPAAALIAFARPAFPIVFGAEWGDAGAMAVALAPWALAQFVTYPLSRAVLVLEAQRTKLVFDVLSLCAVLLVLPLARGSLGLDAASAIGLLALVQAWLYAGLLALLWRIVQVRRPSSQTSYRS